jgi:hypothetical protein
MRKATTDSICAAYAEKRVKITTKPLPDNPNVILFEGDEIVFEFLGKLFLAQAKGINGCGFQIGPKYAGQAFFSKRATLGFYLHRLPCDNAKIEATHGKKKTGAQN